MWQLLCDKKSGVGCVRKEMWRLSQDLLQALILAAHSHSLIEIQGRVISSPDMQRYVEITLHPGVVQGIIIELPANMLPAVGFIHAKLVSVENAILPRLTLD